MKFLGKIIRVLDNRKAYFDGDQITISWTLIFKHEFYDGLADTGIPCIIQS